VIFGRRLPAPPLEVDSVLATGMFDAFPIYIFYCNELDVRFGFREGEKASCLSGVEYRRLRLMRISFQLF
jgi:hypothetical protein